MKKVKRIFKGWMDVKSPKELPQGKGDGEREEMVWGNCRWQDNNPNEKKVKITVEWIDK